MKRAKLLKYILPLFVLLISGCNKTYNKSLSISEMPSTTHYHLGENFSLHGLKVIDNFGIQITDYKSSIENGSLLDKEGTFKVKISKPNYNSCSFDIDVVKIHSLSIKELPSKVNYFVGEEFSLNGLIVSDENNNVVEEYESSIKEGFTFRSAGDVIVTLSKQDYSSVNFSIHVDSAKKLSIDHLPNKLTYLVGETFSSSGLVIKNNKGNAINNYSLSINNGDIFKYSGEIPIIVSCDGYDDVSFNVQVNKNSSISTRDPIDLNVYYINDTHGSFTRTSSDSEAGMAYISSFIKQEKLKNDHTLFISGGDMFQGGIESNDTRGKIMVDALNIMTLDSMTLGNHELDWGEDVLIETLSIANFPVLSCNTFYSDRISRPEWLTPYTVIELDEISVGIIGFERTNMGSSITGSISSKFYFPDASNYIKEYSTELRLSYNCDIVLAVGHDEGYENSINDMSSGLKSLTSNDPLTNRKYVDGLMFAHDHYVKKGQYNNVPYLESGCNGKYLGLMNFSLEDAGYVYEISSSSSTYLNAYNTCTVEDKAITDLLIKYADEIDDPDEVITTFTRSYDRSSFCILVCQAMLWFVNSNKSLFKNQTVYFASHNYSGVRVNRINPGPFTNRDLVEAFPFDNFLTIQRCTSKHINNMINSDWYRTYQEGNIVYNNNVTTCVTISYIAEEVGAYQLSYEEFPPYTAKDALKTYLKQGA